MSDNSFLGTMYFIKFLFVNIKGIWTHLAQKNLRPETKINAIFRLYNWMQN